MKFFSISSFGATKQVPKKWKNIFSQVRAFSKAIIKFSHYVFKNACFRLFTNLGEHWRGSWKGLAQMDTMVCCELWLSRNSLEEKKKYVCQWLWRVTLLGMHFVYVFFVLKQEHIPFYRFARKQRSEKLQTKLFNGFYMLTAIVCFLVSKVYGNWMLERGHHKPWVVGHRNSCGGE